jgi:hypothetical protein
MLRIRKHKHYSTLLPSVLCCWIHWLSVQDNYHYLLCVRHCTRLLGRWTLYKTDWFIDIFYLPVITYTKEEPIIPWWTATSIAPCQEKGLNCFLCIGDHVWYQTTLLPWPQLSILGMDTCPKEPIYWLAPRVHGSIRYCRSKDRILRD